MSEFDLHPERLGTTDEKGRRIFPQPADVTGRYRRLRNWTQAVLIIFFLALPWVKVGGHQAVLLDITNRHFELFGLSLRAHNAPLLLFVFAAFFFGLFFVTSIWGRIWCGWACPQTVFIDGVFRRVERLIEGSAVNRRQLDRAPWSLKKIGLRAAKWVVFMALCAILTHSFMAYFIGTERLGEMMVRPPVENWPSFVFMSVMTGLLAFNFGWFREQFCVIACPYGRFQSVLMDSNSLIIGYDVARGEPRQTIEQKREAKQTGAKLGDCVNCYRCVQVCPVGIDIRRGVQMECIACTGCVDACDEIMTKLKKPTGLIRYDSMRGLAGQERKTFSIRSALYGVIAFGSVAALAILLHILKPVEITVLRAKETPYQLFETPQGPYVANHFLLEISNESEDEHQLTFEAEDSRLELVTALNPVPVRKDDIAHVNLFIRFPKKILIQGQTPVRIRIIDTDSKSQTRTEILKEVSLVGPFS